MTINTGDLERVEEDLAVEKERLSVILRLVSDGVIITDTVGKIVLINRVAVMLTGWDAEEAVGKPLSEVLHIINEDIHEHSMDLVETALKGGIVAPDNRMILVAKDGRERIVVDNVAPIYNKDSNIVGAVLMFRDVTEKQRMEDRLLKLQKLESIGVVAGGIAHDFNNILTGIMGNISLAKLYTNPGDKVFERLAEAEKASIQAKDLTQQLLTFSRNGAPTLKVVSIAQLLKSSARFVLRGSNVKCEFSISDDLWPVEVDEGQISQVVNNMIINAGQAMPKGGMIEVRAENMVIKVKGLLPLKDGNYIKVSIRDQGMGIPEEHLQKIFAPYFTTKQEGSGLGLAISHFIIRNHRGHIEVESQVGVGTTFSIYLPSSPKAVVTEEKQEERLFIGKEKVLVMDDEEIVRELAREMLGNLGYQVTIAKDGTEAIGLYRRAKETDRPFNAVVMDLTIQGGMGGKETVRELAEIDPEVKAIVSSGYSNDPIMTDFLKYGFRGAIAKPYKIRELSEVLYKVIKEPNRPEAHQ